MSEVSLLTYKVIPIESEDVMEEMNRMINFLSFPEKDKESFVTRTNRNKIGDKDAH